MSARPDVDKQLAALKGFQRKTVDHVFQRMYRDPDPAYRFLVADEVGLGKTLIARGIIAKAIDHLWESTERIDIVYICSSVAIAGQNLKKLAPGHGHRALTTRLTLLPKELKGLNERRLNFVSFTPGTSFDMGNKSGRCDERVVLYWLLHDAIGYSSGLRNVLQGNVGRDRWLEEVHASRRPELDPELHDKFAAVLRAPSAAPIRAELERLTEAFHRARESWPAELRYARNALISQLRMLLARTCVDALEPDLIILDEFQRFRELLHGDDDMADLARQMWTYVTPEKERARVLLLSATPYRMYSTDGEVGEDDHYPDFIQTTRFLFDDEDAKLDRFESRLRRYRKAVHGALRGDDGAVPAARRDVEEDLRRVMVRTERVTFTEDRQGMMEESPWKAPIGTADVKQWLLVDGLSRTLGDRDAVEMWKSAPYLPQFMKKSYRLGQKLADSQADPEVVALLKRHRKDLFRKKKLDLYRPLDPANGRLRALMEEMVDGGQWQLLWVPPTLPYWPLGGPFAQHADFTKRLVFSAWNVVPDAISALVSYRAERLAHEGDPDVTYKTVQRKHRGLLRFSVSDGRETGMPALALQYPSLVLAERCAPKAMRAEGIRDVREQAQRRVESLLAPLAAGPGVTADERWYWAAPALLDAKEQRSAPFLREWAHRAPTVDGDAAEPSDDTRFDDHVALLRRVVSGEEPLGPKPDDLAEVVTELALGAPGVLALRTLRPAGVTDLERQRAAALVAEGFRTLFNQPVAMSIVRKLHPDVPYWRATLRYAIDGGLAAVLDEHAHRVFEEERGLADLEPTELVDNVAHQLGHAPAIKMSRVTPHHVRFRGEGFELDPVVLRTHYALRYGKIVGDDGGRVMREQAVRRAFNSPFRPFILASTSIGQEGLDFHPWCHAIVHWNLPGNPVDLEQREGRVHRYEGHAVRKNVAARFGEEALRRWRDGEDLWKVLFDLAAEARPEGASDLVPWWISEGPCKVQRRVPTLPLSQEEEKLAKLKRDLVAYRLAFGQPRQQELVELVAGSDVSVERLDSWTIDLRPLAAASGTQREL